MYVDMGRVPVQGGVRLPDGVGCERTAWIEAQILDPVEAEEIFGHYAFTQICLWYMLAHSSHLFGIRFVTVCSTTPKKQHQLPSVTDGRERRPKTRPSRGARTSPIGSP